jgi:hypothetical protein
VAVSITHFVCFKVRNLIQTLSRFGPIATGWPWAIITVLRMKTVIYVAMEIGRAVKPRASTNEDASRKPLRAIVPIGGTFVRRGIVVPIRTHRRNSDLDGYLSLYLGSSRCEANSGNSR